MDNGLPEEQLQRDWSEDWFFELLKGKRVTVRLLVQDGNGQASVTGVVVGRNEVDNLYLEDNGKVTLVRKAAIASVAEAITPGRPAVGPPRQP